MGQVVQLFRVLVESVGVCHLRQANRGKFTIEEKKKRKKKAADSRRGPGDERQDSPDQFAINYTHYDKSESWV